MDSLKSAFKSVKQRIASQHDDSHDHNAGLSKNAQKRLAKRKQKDAHRKEKEKYNHEQPSSQMDQTETASQKAHWGDAPVDIPEISKITPDLKPGFDISLRARIHQSRAHGAKLHFIILRQQTNTIQGVLQVGDGISEHMVQTAATSERNNGNELSKNGEPDSKLTEGSQSRPPVISDHVRFENRVIDLRTDVNQAIFRINSGVCKFFRNFLDENGFIEIHTPKLQASATESGASVFKVEYFKRPAFFAQSPQLAKQMCISADFERVYEIGPVFRAENSNTPRHLTEFTGLDLEMAIDRDYSEVRNMIDQALLSVFKGLQSRYQREIDIVKRQFPHDDLVFLDKTLMLTFDDAVKMLNDAGYTDDGKPIDEHKDFSTPTEIRLGQLIKEEYKTDYYIIDKFPAAARPFYAMPDPSNPKVTNSFDIFLRGEEILSGGQRIHEETLLQDQMVKAGIMPEDMMDYLDSFKYGAPPHGGGGLGLERVTSLFLKLNNVRNASLFPRDPKSLPMHEPVKRLRHPEANTLEPSGEQPALEKLIANYGDSSNTFWLDEAYTKWRHSSGAIVGYKESDGYAIVFGDPLCDESQYAEVTQAFIDYLRKAKLKPIWVCVDHKMEQILGREFGWKTIGCAAEDRIDLTDHAHPDRNVTKKVNHAVKEGVKVVSVGGLPNKELQDKIDEQIATWQESREGTQVHTTQVMPWKDPEHRRYFYGQRGEQICGLLVLAQLSQDHGYQIKWALSFPEAPSGTSELLLTTAFDKLREEDLHSVTFGVGATEDLVPGAGHSHLRGQALSRIYKGITHAFTLTNKTEFRQKMGVKEEMVYVCYPKHGLGIRGINAMINSMKDG